jgi:hypothetical protein
MSCFEFNRRGGCCFEYTADVLAFQRWFGTTNHPNQVQGLFDRIVSGDKGNISFTCDDVDS